jgi:hypothetical protein
LKWTGNGLTAIGGRIAKKLPFDLSSKQEEAGGRFFTAQLVGALFLPLFDAPFDFSPNPQNPKRVLNG